jgi:hypothetical protein
MGSYPRFCGAFQRKAPAVICLTPVSGMAAPDLPGVTRLHRRRCDETESFSANLRSASEPGPLALLPVARSPSRPCCQDRWWALTPPVRPLSAHANTDGNTFCCGCSQDAALAGLPPLAVSWGDLDPIRFWASQSPGCGAGSREVPLGGSAHPATAHPSIHGELYHETLIASSDGYGVSRGCARI